ncbi:guanine methyltransferase Trm5 [Talaromyces proteolyticus]|uniref:tRNA (guanine(37)-N1)-methyltransferase n=1 Tax=Talaromyces proteolyticus TaxID=1131652 RepID=A0AAD4KK22_9EURO|nr:guanine methyltransferase Trm5 [Talaromyces proteolyticus]KAH8694140.1 guanine methyltransferase Trm5 [Talaromyces proteolyticus]
MASTAVSKQPSPPNGESSAMFRPPVNRAMRVLDRSFFHKSIPVSAATVFENKDIMRVRKRLVASKDLLDLPRYNVCRVDPPRSLVVGNGQSLELSNSDLETRKCLLLGVNIKHDDITTWSPTINELVNEGSVGLGLYTVQLDYSHWTYSDIIDAILPEEDVERGDAPEGFTLTGHVLHLNLRERWAPYKHLIAEILLDKNPNTRTVINKTQDVGSESQFRTFPFEILAGENDMNVTVHEQGCEFKFDFSRVYWNSRLETEHRRLVNTFKEGELVADVMAGVGPFAVPAGKKKIFVWANDLNPHGWEVMEQAIAHNHVSSFVSAYNLDGREFIRETANLMDGPVHKAIIWPKAHRSRTNPEEKPLPPPRTFVRPATVDHFVMNLPATAIDFLDAFVGVYTGRERFFEPHTDRKLPLIHVYCFSGHSDDERNEHVDICQRISDRLGFTITADDTVGGSGNPERELHIHNVRLVSPNKQMFCATFRLPQEVAFKSI